jgi:phospholipase C
MENAVGHRPMTEFYKDVSGKPEKFSAFCWIEPTYFQPGANDDHPPHDVLEGKLLIANVYNALRANEPLWNASLLVVLFDEHGAFTITFRRQQQLRPIIIKRNTRSID